MGETATLKEWVDLLSKEQNFPQVRLKEGKDDMKEEEITKS